MESSLHQELKKQHAQPPSGRLEVMVDGWRIDAIDPEGWLIEVQFGPLSALKRKLDALLPSHKLRVVRPIVSTRRIIRRSPINNAIVFARKSPRRESPLDLFDELVSLVPWYPHPNLEIQVPEVEVDEIRVAWPRRPGYRVVDRALTRISPGRCLRDAEDLWSLLPPCFEMIESFTTRDLAEVLNRSDSFAQRVAYCLRKTNAVESIGFRNRRALYRRLSLVSQDSIVPDGSNVFARVK